MKKLIEILLSLATGFVLAQFLALFYGNWYFAGHSELKIALLGIPFGAVFWLLLQTHWRKLWQFICGYLLLNWLLAVITAGSIDLSRLTFTGVLDYEAALVWVPLMTLWIYGGWRLLLRERRRQSALNAQRRQLILRRRLRRLGSTPAMLLAAMLSLLCHAGNARAEDGELPAVGPGDRHEQLYDATKVVQPAWPSGVPESLQLRKRDYFYISIDNRKDGEIVVHRSGGKRLGEFDAAALESSVVGHVLAPVANINRKGFTASGWAPISSVCASSVNAIHIKTDHNWNDGRGVIFSLVPIEFATFDPKSYKSYFNQSSTLFTDIVAGSEIFGGNSAPGVGNRLLVSSGDWQAAQPAAAGYVPAENELIVIEVARARFNPEWVEFENRFGGIIWLKERDQAAYPIGQVLKPVSGVGRFLGTQYADLGRIRAAHPGVIDISTTPMNSIGGFQIIPRDHAMSPEMTNARIKTQWMVVGPLWALDPSWEGLPPLFSDYLYPAYTPLSREADWEDIYLNRFEVKAQYSDNEEDPLAWIDVRPTANLDNYALKTLTGIRLYFPIP